MKQDTLSSTGKMLIHLSEAAFIGLFIDKKEGDFDFILLIAAFILAIAGLIAIALSAKAKKDEELKFSTGHANKRTIKFPRNTTFVVEESKD